MKLRLTIPTKAIIDDTKTRNVASAWTKGIQTDRKKEILKSTLGGNDTLEKITRDIVPTNKQKPFSKDPLKEISTVLDTFV